MKVMTILGTRPEIIRLSRVIPLLDRHFEHVLVFTGQNFDPNLSDRFFHELEVRSPDYRLECRADTSVGQIAAILTGCEAAISAERPERLIILGDTNSGLSAIVAKRKGVQVFHMEAGNRCYDDRVPEEVNRRIIDHSSDVLMPYTERSRQNLLREGIAGERIYVTGNPIYEVLRHFEPRIAESVALKDLGLETGRYFLVTMHREENVDIPPRLESLIRALAFLCEKYRVPVVVSTHPRTRKRMVEIGVSQDNPMIRFLQPFGFFDFIHLERNAFCVLSDSGTVQEECCIFKVPNVTLRDVTERPETIEVGSNVLSGVEPESILRCVDAVLSHGCHWDPPREYLVGNVSGTIANIIGGYLKF